MATFIEDRILDPPDPPIAIPVGDLGGNSEVQELIDAENGSTQGYFEKLSSGWAVVYREAPNEEPFLCMNWAAHRLRDDIRPGTKFAAENQWQTVDLTPDTMATMLQRDFGLVPWVAGRGKKVCVLWTIPSGNVGHIQVYYNGRWESKLSQALWVLSNGEDDFQWYRSSDRLTKSTIFMRR
ncbi:hypothetical protein LTR36_007870 [Oleoguttula mirabilis]|uniref:Uncharacterized protein n=1 Tax=Oleoguttula mirabilis TaxID=1507867 RepID=A0AAV9J9R4_9PEZI|nr:hypothetical protein LTR36_007870 [Oleoguttula mirabilis]